MNLIHIPRRKNSKKDNSFADVLILNWLDHLETTFDHDNVIESLDKNLNISDVHLGWHTILTKKKESYKPKKGVVRRPYIMEYLNNNDIDEIIAANKDISREFEFTPSVEILSNILELSYTEKLFLECAAMLRNSSYNLQEIFATFRTKDEINFFADIFNTTPENIKKAKEGFIFKSGIIQKNDDYEDCFYRLQRDFEDVLVNNPNYTQQDLVEKLFPNSIVSDLSLDDYPHLKEEIDITGKVINKSLENKNNGINVLFYGIAGTGKSLLAFSLANHHDWDLKVIGDNSRKDTKEKSRAQRLTSLKVAIKIYGGHPKSVLLFDEMEDLFNKTDNDASFSKSFINRIIETTPVPIIWTTNNIEILGQPVLRRMTYNIGFKIPPIFARKKMWESHAKKFELEMDSDTINDLATDYPIMPALIKNSVMISKMAGIEKDKIPKIVESLDTLVRFGEKTPTNVKFKKYISYDLSYINASEDMVKITEKIKKTTKPFSMCLYGASGSGKSEYVRYVADLIGKKVLFKKASDLISKWVGETEQKIAEAFEEAKEEKFFLLIDEGDTFLRNRDNAINPWEKSMVNEMLIQMENHTEPFAITTNLMNDIDKAALRRFIFKIKFDYITPDQAEKIFKSYFGVDAPSEIRMLNKLCPGDFSAIKKKADILEITDSNELYDMLYEECQLKGESFGKIGF